MTRLHLIRIRLNAGGYDDSGRYWGIGAPLYRTFDDNDFSEYMRARDRLAAKSQIREIVPTAEFYR